MSNDVIALQSNGNPVYYCPGCREHHVVDVAPNRNPVTQAQWAWNGDKERPTFSPSVNVCPDGPRRCHHYVTGGRIAYLSDCHHALAGQAMPLPPIDFEP